VIAELGGAGLGLVWGWLLGSNWKGARRTMLLGAAVLANAVLAARLGGEWAALALVAAALVGAWLHVTWMDELRARRARAEGEE
jgi:NhaP-type Na+/H+ or K+/H+ antiporter